MLRITAISLILMVSATSATRYPVKSIPERIDDEGQTWVGPIRLCPLGVTDQELNACAAENIELLKPALLQGFPVFNNFDYALNLGPVQIKVAMKNVQIKEISEILNMGLTFNTTSKSAKFIFEVRNLVVSSFYKVGGTAVIVPIRGSGPAIIKLGHIKWTGYLPLSVVTRDDGVEVIQMKKTVTEEFKFEGLRFAVQGLFPKIPAFGQAVHYFANNYGIQIFDVFMRDQLVPAIGKLVTEELVNPYIYNIPQLAPYLQ